MFKAQKKPTLAKIARMGHPTSRANFKGEIKS
jgi:hypothetical protein